MKDKKGKESAQNLIAQYKNEAEITDKLLDWQYYAEMLRGNQNIYRDKTTKQVISLTTGAFIPDFKRFLATDQLLPTDPHLITLANGVLSRIMANPLLAEVMPASSDDADKDSAKASTMLLRYYDRALDGMKIREQTAEWLLPTGNAFAKIFWDKNAGDYVFGSDPTNPLSPGLPMQDKDGNEVHMGDISWQVVAPHSIMRPKGIANMEDLPWIGQKMVLSIEEIKKRWGKEVEPEDNLQDVTSLGATTAGVGGHGNGELKEHALVYEIYIRPNSDYPKGRRFVATTSTVLEDGVYDEGLTSSYSEEWHPFVKCGWIAHAGDFWDDTAFKYVMDLQVELNKLTRQISDSKKILRGYFIAEEGSFDEGKINITGSGDGIPVLKFKPGRQPPVYVPPPSFNNDLVARQQYVIQRMNDILAYYEVTRGGTPASVTSGVQVQNLQMASQNQANALLTNIAEYFKAIWKKTLRLCAVHYQTDRVVRVIGENQEVIAASIRPDQINSDDVDIQNRGAFFVTPEARRQQLLQMAQMGLIDLTDPLAKKKYAEVMEFGDVDTFFDDILADLEMAKNENRLFMEGNFNESIPAIINQTQTDYQAAQAQYEQDFAGYGQQLEEWNAQNSVGDMAIEQQAAPIHPNSPPPPEPVEPTPPNFWCKAKPWDNDKIHMYQHDMQRKALEFVARCQQVDGLYEFYEFHIQSHKEAIVSKMLQDQALAMQAMPPGMAPGIAPPGGGPPSPGGPPPITPPMAPPIPSGAAK